ncbi:hypothetical protein ECE50_012475 [Chitinophaga sp. Mgbs1]|uniref:Uncharacterized protein n=1 Tax=Chitinophaga solisilvae TaxID=1233460 RepID=A0A433WHK2_9BACT|nr:hypothetical protein [Chitinophaga solisilvae]
MNTIPAIRSWLETAFTEPPFLLNEEYFFDKRNRQFFSIFITDYFLCDPASGEGITDMPYSPEELAVLKERIDRLEEKSADLLYVPRLTVAQRIDMIRLFLNEQGLPGDEELDNITKAVNGRSNLDVGAALLPEMRAGWQRFSNNYLHQVIDAFCTHHHIDLASCSVWTDEKVISMQLNTGN